MTFNLIMLAALLFIIVLSSFAASLIPGRPIPEVVFFVFAGAIAGPYGLQLLRPTEPLMLISRLGLGFLFLLAGYELNPKDLVGTRGRHASISWMVSLVLALIVTPFLDLGLDSTGMLAFAIALTTTAYGTLVPIVSDRKLLGTPVGDVIDSYGAIGEILPVLAMSILLIPSRPKLASIVYLLVFIGICVYVALRANAAMRVGTRVFTWLRTYAGSSTYPTLRITILLLVSLLLLAQAMELDAVLGAFAAGFILRYLTPDDKSLQERLQTVGNGFFIPIFFVVSGLSVNLSAALAAPWLLVLYMLLLLLVRGVVVGVSLKVFPETRGMSLSEKFSASLYCTMALPLIVALTEVAVDAGAMPQSMASVLVTAGALTVLIIPVITTATRNVIAVHPMDAMHEIQLHPDDVRDIVHEHMLARQEQSRAFYAERRRAKKLGRKFSSADYLALYRQLQKQRSQGTNQNVQTPDTGGNISQQTSDANHSSDTAPTANSAGHQGTSADKN